MTPEEARRRELNFELQLSETIQLLAEMVDTGEVSLNVVLDDIVERVHREQAERRGDDENAIIGLRKTGEFRATIDFRDEQRIVDRVNHRLHEAALLYEGLQRAREGLCAIPLLADEVDDVARDALVVEIDKVLASFDK